MKNVFVAGDMHRGQSLVVWAIREGREAARAVDESLMGYSNYENQTVFKIYYSDIGLLSMRMELTPQQNTPLLAIRQHRRSRLYHPMRLNEVRAFSHACISSKIRSVVSGEIFVDFILCLFCSISSMKASASPLFALFTRRSTCLEMLRNEMAGKQEAGGR